MSQAMLAGKKLGLLVSVPPDSPQYKHAVALARAALAEGVEVYFYCIDEAVHAIGKADLKQLQGDGMNLYACAYGAYRRSQPLTDDALFSGLNVVHELIARTDRFVAFN